MYSISRIDLGSEQLKAAQKIRAEVYLRMGFLSESDLTDGLDIDEYDDRSIHIGAFDLLGELVGTIRIIMPGPVDLSVEKLFGLTADKRSVEISRYAILEQHRSLAVALGLCRAAYHEIEQLGIDAMYAVLEQELLNDLLWLGFPFEILGGPKRVYNSLNYPTCCKHSEVIACIHERDRKRPQKLAGYFEQPFSFEEAMVYEELFSPTSGQG